MSYIDSYGNFNMDKFVTDELILMYYSLMLPSHKPIHRSDDRLCNDCNKDLLLDYKDYYSVTDELWDKYGVGKKELCMDCFETRIGRKLTYKDIKVCVLTVCSNYYTRAILDKHYNLLNDSLKLKKFLIDNYYNS